MDACDIGKFPYNDAPSTMHIDIGELDELAAQLDAYVVCDSCVL